MDEDELAARLHGFCFSDSESSVGGNSDSESDDELNALRPPPLPIKEEDIVSVKNPRCAENSDFERIKNIVCTPLIPDANKHNPVPQKQWKKGKNKKTLQNNTIEKMSSQEEKDITEKVSHIQHQDLKSENIDIHRNLITDQNKLKTDCLVSFNNHETCAGCYSNITSIDMCVIPHLNKKWHYGCFRCAVCSDVLVGLACYAQYDKIYCQRHHPQLIQSGFNFLHIDEHEQQNSCYLQYNARLTQQNHMQYEKPVTCYNNNIRVNHQDVLDKNKNHFLHSTTTVCKQFHGNHLYYNRYYDDRHSQFWKTWKVEYKSSSITMKQEIFVRTGLSNVNYFRCTHCRTSLADVLFTDHLSKLYCIRCFKELFIVRCTLCNNPITNTSSFPCIMLEGGHRYWHDHCFFCISCRLSLIGCTFITSDGYNNICYRCFRQGGWPVSRF